MSGSWAFLTRADRAAVGIPSDAAALLWPPEPAASLAHCGGKGGAHPRRSQGCLCSSSGVPTSSSSWPSTGALKSSLSLSPPSCPPCSSRS